MSKYIQLFILVLTFKSFYSQADVNFKRDFNSANPVKSTSDISINEKIKIHDEFLRKAISDKNTTYEFYGLLYLFNDYFKEQSYVEAAKKLLKADSIAQATGNLSWQSIIYVKNAAMEDEINNNREKAIEFYESAIKLCVKVKDSTCIGDNLEQIGSLYALLKNFKKAHEYFDLAMPYLRKFSDRVKMGTTYNNYSNLLSYEGLNAEALIYIDSAIFIAEEFKNDYKKGIYLNNKAGIYAGMGLHNKAIEIYKTCVELNRRNRFNDHLLNDYNSLKESYVGLGDYRSAFEYSNLYNTLKDSIKGEDVKLKIGELNVKYMLQSKQLELEKKELALIKANHSLTNRTAIILLILFCSLIGMLIWRWQIKKNKVLLNQNKEHLNELTQILIKKNSQLVEFEEQLANLESYNNQSQHTADFENTLYNQRVLTNEDWNSFKMHFEKAYPGYLLRLRNMFSGLTDAEERLFLFIKLNLKSKEIASILGISVGSVKKTRNRLRKRLELAEETDLDVFVLGF